MNKLFTHQMQHRHGGNGFAVTEVVDKDYVRITDLGPNIIGKQHFLVYLPMLSVEQRYKGKGLADTPIREDHELSPELLEILTPIREALKSGKTKVVNTRLVYNPF